MIVNTGTSPGTISITASNSQIGIGHNVYSPDNTIKVTNPSAGVIGLQCDLASPNGSIAIGAAGAGLTQLQFVLTNNSGNMTIGNPSGGLTDISWALSSPNNSITIGAPSGGVTHLTAVPGVQSITVVSSGVIPSGTTGSNGVYFGPGNGSQLAVSTGNTTTYPNGNQSANVAFSVILDPYEIVTPAAVYNALLGSIMGQERGTFQSRFSGGSGGGMLEGDLGQTITVTAEGSGAQTIVFGVSSGYQSQVTNAVNNSASALQQVNDLSSQIDDIQQRLSTLENEYEFCCEY